MGIQFTKAYVSGDKVFPTLTEAQIAAIATLLVPDCGVNVSQTAAKAIVGCQDEILDILTTTDSSRPKARKVNGGSKPRKKAPASPAYSDIARLEEVASQVQTEAQRVLQAQ